MKPGVFLAIGRPACVLGRYFDKKGHPRFVGTDALSSTATPEVKHGLDTIPPKIESCLSLHAQDLPKGLCVQVAVDVRGAPLDASA